METEGVYRTRNKESSLNESKQSWQVNSTQYNTTSHHSTDGKDIVFWIAAGVAEAVGIACIVLVVYWCNLYGGLSWKDENLQFFVHPVLMVVGLIFCYGNAILTFRVLHFVPKIILKLVHAGLHISAIVLSIIGLVAVFENRRRTYKADLYSLHSWLGLAAFGSFCLQYLVSFVAFLFPGLPVKFRALFMPFHTFFGVAIFVLVVITAHTGLTERLLWTKNYTSGETTREGVIGNVLGLLLIVFALLVVFLVTKSKYKRKPLPSEIVPTN